MTITERFDAIVTADDLYLSMVHIKGVCQFLGMKNVEVDFVIRAGIPLSPLKSVCLVEYFPYYPNSRSGIRKLTFREKSFFQLDVWKNWYFLGSKNTMLGALIPLALQRNNISPEYVSLSDQGFYFMSPELTNFSSNFLLAESVISTAEWMLNKGIISYEINSQTQKHMEFILLLQILQLKGGSILSYPQIAEKEICTVDKENTRGDNIYADNTRGGYNYTTHAENTYGKNTRATSKDKERRLIDFSNRRNKNISLCSLWNKTQVYCQLPVNYDMYKINEAIARIRSGTLPYEYFSGFWNRFPIDITADDLYQKKMIIHYLAILAYVKLSEKYPYLAPLIYEVIVDPLMQIKAPLATLEQRLIYEQILKELFLKYPYDNFLIIEYKDNTDLLVKRFAYEKRAELVFAPHTPYSIGNAFSKDLLVYGNVFLLDDELDEEKMELERLLRKKPDMIGLNREKRCLETCGIERSICCIDVSSNASSNNSSYDFSSHNSPHSSHNSPHSSNASFNNKNFSHNTIPRKIRMEKGDLDMWKGNALQEHYNLSVMDEERLLRIEQGMQGYFQLGGVLKGLYLDPPINANANVSNNATLKIESIPLESDILLFVLKHDDKEIPIMTIEQKQALEEDIHTQLSTSLEDGSIMTPWLSASLD